MWYNGIMTWMLKSPLQFFVNQSMMLITFTGLKSGKTYTTPVSYFRIPGSTGEYLLTISQRDRTWWRNLRGGAPVGLLLKGQQVSASAEAIEGQTEVESGFADLFSLSPKLAKYMNIGIEPDGKPNQADIQQLAKTSILVRMDIQ